jgi:hypothetical protein
MSGNSPFDQSASLLGLDFNTLLLGGAPCDRRLSTRDGAGANAPVMGTHKAIATATATATATESKRTLMMLVLE